MLPSQMFYKYIEKQITIDKAIVKYEDLPRKCNVSLKMERHYFFLTTRKSGQYLLNKFFF